LEAGAGTGDRSPAGSDACKYFFYSLEHGNQQL
jgi:hypothetical protein